MFTGGGTEKLRAEANKGKAFTREKATMLKPERTRKQKK